MRNFISFEGLDGCGKTTSAKALVKKLNDSGVPAIYTSSPGSFGDSLKEKIYSNKDLDPVTESLLFAAYLREHIIKVIKPALDEGKIVVCDRFFDSTVAYQGYAKRGAIYMPEITDVIFMVNGLVYLPDLTFLVNTPTEICFNRIQNRNLAKTKFDEESTDFFERVNRGFELLSILFSDRIKTVDGTKTTEEITEKTFKEISEYLNRIKNTINT